MRILYAITLAALLALATSAHAAHWTAIGPWGGIVGNTVVDPQTPSTVFAMTAGGIFRSTDGGASWTSRNGGVHSISSYDAGGRLAIDAQNPSTLYLVRGGGFPDELLKTTDAGATWSPTALVDLDNARSVAVHPLDSNTIYVIDADGVRVTADGGTSWQKRVLLPDSGDGQSLVLDPTDPAIAYMAANYGQSGSGEGGVYKTTDHGVTWQRKNVGLPMDVDTIALAIDPVDPLIVHVATYSSTFHSADGGDTWTETLTPVACVAYDGLAADQVIPNRLYVGSCHGMYASSDGGVTWAPASTGITTPSILSVNTGPGGAVFAGTLGHGLFRSVDGGATWTPENQGIAAHSVNTFVSPPSGTSTIYAATRREGIQKTTDGGATWARADAGISYADVEGVGTVVLDPQVPSTLFATADGRIFKSTDAGASWSPSSSGISAAAYVWAVAVDPTSSATVYAGVSQSGVGNPLVYKSTDGGGSWSPTPLLSTAALIKIGVVAIDPVTPANVYAGGGRNAMVARSTDGGASWTPVTVSFTGFQTSAIAIDPQHPSTLYAGTFFDGLYRSLDGGVTFSRVVPYPGFGVATAILDPATPSHVFASFDPGVTVASLDGGATFADVTGDLKAEIQYTIANALAVDPANPVRLLAATDGGSIQAGLLTPCAADVDCAVIRDLCQVATCAPSNPGADAFGCVTTPRQCPGDECHSDGTCNPETGVCSNQTLPDGSFCATAQTCTTNTCHGGVCIREFIPQNCFDPGARGGATLTIHDVTSSKASFAWKWGKGDGFDNGHVGNPFTPLYAFYRLCVADLGGPLGAPRMLLDVQLPSGGTCGTRSCWSAAGIDVKYQDRSLANGGVRSVKFHPGIAGKAKVTLSAKGVHLPLAVAPPYTTGVIVELRRENTPVCWQATFDQLIRRNQSGLFTAKSGSN